MSLFGGLQLIGNLLSGAARAAPDPLACNLRAQHRSRPCRPDSRHGWRQGLLCRLFHSHRVDGAHHSPGVQRVDAVRQQVRACGTDSCVHSQACSNYHNHVPCRLPAVLELAPLCARVLITERSSEAARARLLGYIGVSIGIGIVVRVSGGPSAGVLQMTRCS